MMPRPMADRSAPSPSACSPATSARSRAASRSSRTTIPRAGRSSREIYPQTGNAAVVGFTGPPGAGKSTLIGALVKPRRARRPQVAVLSIDPCSPFRGGALLGDRIRLTEHFLDPGVFIRSMATRGALGGLAEAALQTALLMDAAGSDDVFLETVGVGQAEVDVIDHADTVVLVLIPGSGDSIQALKAGVMEIPDVIVVNKCRPPAHRHDGARDQGRAHPRAAGATGRCRSSRPRPRAARASRSSRRSSPSTARTSRREGTLSERRRRNLLERGARARHRAPAPRAGGDAATRTPRFAQLLDEVVARRLDPASAAATLLERQEAKDIA